MDLRTVPSGVRSRHMRGLRWTAGLGALLAMLAACQTVAPDHGPTQPKTVLANGQPLPSGCPAGGGTDGHTVAFVADGNAWVLDPSTMDVSCVFAAPQPGPFTWNPRGDRALLDGLRIESIRGHELRSPTLPTSPISAWGHPIGKAVVFVSPNQHQLVKVYPGTQQHDEITPVAGVRYLDVVYHPSGLAIAFIVDTRKRQEIWLSSNIGRDPVRLVFGVIGWLDDETVLVGTGGCTAAGTTNLSAAKVTPQQHAVTPLVTGVEFAAA